MLSTPQGGIFNIFKALSKQLEAKQPPACFAPLRVRQTETLPTRSVPGQAAGQLAHPPPEAQRRRLHPGAGLHGESVHVRPGADLLPGLVPHGERLLRPHALHLRSVFPSGAEFAPSVLQDLFWAVYVGECSA